MTAFARHNKAFIGTAGALAIIGGFSAPTIMNSYSSSSSLFRGGLSDYLTSSKKFEDPYKGINLNEANNRSVNVKSSGSLVKQSLKTDSIGSIDLSKNVLIDSGEPAKHVAGLYKEIDREVVVLDIDTEGKNEVKKTAKKIYKSETTKYLSSANKVRQYNEPSHSRGKRSSGSPKIISKLSESEKSSLQKYYEKYSHLRGFKNKLTKRLRMIDGSDPSKHKSLSEICSSCNLVINALGQIGWKNPALNIFSKKDKEWSVYDIPPKNRSWESTWGLWEMSKHPYYPFWRWDTRFSNTTPNSSRAKWREAVQKIFQARKTYYDTVNSGSWRWCGLTNIFQGAAGMQSACGYERKAKMEQAIKDAHAELELHIGSVMMNWMNQLNVKKLR